MKLNWSPMRRFIRHPIRTAGVLAAAFLTIGFSTGGAEAPLADPPAEAISAAEAVSASTADLMPAAALAPTVEVAPAPSDSPAPAAHRVALQAGHWRAAEAPAELARIRSNGTNGGGKAEWEVTLRIAELAAERLTAAGIEVDILPATVPPSYRADLFIAIHADGNNDSSASGFTVAAPRQDRSGHGGRFAQLLAASYREATGLRHRTSVPRRMTNYYAFNSRRYEHSVDPETVSVILETGFLTNPSDRRIIVDAPERSAEGIVAAVLSYLAPAPPPPAPIAR